MEDKKNINYEPDKTGAETDSYEDEPIIPDESSPDFDPSVDYSEGLDEPEETPVYGNTDADREISGEDLDAKDQAAEDSSAERTVTESPAADGPVSEIASAESGDSEEADADDESAGNESAQKADAEGEKKSDEEECKQESPSFLDDYVSGEPDEEEKINRKKRHPLRVLLIIVLLLAAAVYGYGVYYFRDHFQMNTAAVSGGNRLDISGWTQGQLDESLGNFANGYTFTITDIQGSSYRIKGSDISYTAVGDEAEENLLSAQNPYQWPLSLFRSTQLDLTLTMTYDENALRDEISALDFMQPQNMTAPVNASVTITADGYEINDAVTGTTVLTDQVLDEAVAVVDAGEASLTLTESDYQQPEILANDKSITDFTDQLDKYLSSTVTYDIDGADEEIGRSQIMSMLNIDTEAKTVSLNEDAVTSYVQSLATKYNTYGSERQFRTSQGDTITIGGGDYGWVVSKSGEKEQLMEDLQSGAPVEREPVYEQTAVQRATKEGETDIGNTYIEIDYTNQHIYYYKDGELQLDSDIVSGNTTIGNGSPDGIFKINYKKSPAVLVGEDYQSDVTYFMVFSYNVGIHDASWRSSFGGSIYTSNGSHGCVNVPLSFARNLYDVLAEKTPVVAYYRNSVTLTSENARIANAYSYRG